MKRARIALIVVFLTLILSACGKEESGAVAKRSCETKTGFLDDISVPDCGYW